MILADRLRALRQRNDVKQETLARLLNISQSGYSKYEKERAIIPLDNLWKIADFYNTSIDYLVGRIDDQEAYSRKSKSKR